MIYNTYAKEENKVSNLGFKDAKTKTLIVQQLLVRKCGPYGSLGMKYKCKNMP